MKCGVGDYTALLAGSIAERFGADVTVGVLTTRGLSQEVPGVQVLSAIDSWGISSLSQVLCLVKEWQPDIVHVQYPSKGYATNKMPLLLPLIFRMKGMRVVQTWHEPFGWLRSVRYLSCAVTRDALIVVESDYRTFLPAWFAAILRRKRFFRYIPVGSNIPSRPLAERQKSQYREKFCPEGCNLVAYFGFVAPPKGVEQLFEIADPTVDRLLLICELNPEDQYQNSLLQRMESPDWQGRSYVTGYREAPEVAALLACADIAVFPFLNGATSRNASILAARAQGTCVVTTSLKRHGYNEEENVFYARPGDLDGMRRAVRSYSGTRSAAGKTPDWQSIAESHLELYQEIMTEPRVLT